MKCPKCQTDNPDTQKFCGECATPLTASEAAPSSFTKTIATPVGELTRGTLFADRIIGSSTASRADEIDLNPETLFKVLCGGSDYHESYKVAPEDVKVVSISTAKGSNL